MDLLGYLAVDSGTIMIGDPCYTLPNDGSCRTKEAKNWLKFVEATREAISEPFGKDTALVLNNFGGDGRFPVYGIYRNGMIAEVHIVLDGSEEEAP